MKKFSIIMLLLGISALTQAANGVYAINTLCALTGCFTGDAPGLPITITLPGSYKLTSNLVSNNQSVNVIEIFSDNTTLDLNGFAIIGPKSCTGAGSSLSCTLSSMAADGIKTVGQIRNITVKNGSVRGFDNGVAIITTSYFENHVSNILATENDKGITLHSGVISDCQANRNAKYGFSSAISAFNNGFLKVKDSYASGNFLHSVHAEVCSNVFFINNGSNTSADADCANYTNGSFCKVTACINN